MKPKLLIWMGTIILAAFLNVGCDREGPLEEAGESIDNAARDTKDAVKEGADETRDAARDATR
jgi:hypothetical protein